jgi:hypothetical protein
MALMTKTMVKMAADSSLLLYLKLKYQGKSFLKTMITLGPAQSVQMMQ